MQKTHGESNSHFARGLITCCASSTGSTSRQRVFARLRWLSYWAWSCLGATCAFAQRGRYHDDVVALTGKERLEHVLAQRKVRRRRTATRPNASITSLRAALVEDEALLSAASIGSSLS